MWNGIVKGIMLPVYLTGAAVGIIGYAVSKPLLAFLEWGWRKWFRKAGRQHPHGDADWADWKELRQAGMLKPGGFAVGTVKKRFGKATVYTHRERSLIMYGPPGSGKSLAAAASLCKADGWDTIVYDPASSILPVVRASLEARGYEIRVLDLNDPAAGQKYNPLTYLFESGPVGFDTDVRSLATLISPVDDTTEISAHFTGIVMKLVAAFITHTAADQKNWKLAAIARNMGEEAIRDRILKEMKQSPEDFVRLAASAVSGAGDKEKGSFYTTAFNRMELWVNARIKALVDDPEHWSFDDMFDSKKPVALFINGGLSAREMTGAYARVVLGNAINTVRRRKDQNIRNKKALKLFVDEAANIGRCTALLDAQRELRKAGTRVCLFYIDRTDMRNAYGKDAGMLEGSCDVVVPGGIRDKSLLQDVCELIGNRTEITEGQSVNAHGSSESRSQFGRKLISVDELMRLPGDEVICLLGNMTARLKKPWAIKGDKPTF